MYCDFKRKKKTDIGKNHTHLEEQLLEFVEKVLPHCLDDLTSKTENLFLSCPNANKPDLLYDITCYISVQKHKLHFPGI